MAFFEDLGLQFAGGALNSLLGGLSAKQAFERQKELMDYQFKKYTSPQAQVSNLAAAGINPAVALGNQSPVFSSAPSPASVAPAQFGIGTTSLTDLSNYMLAKANAKKAGVETRKTDAEADAITFENELNRIFKQPERVANLMSAYKAMQLQDDEHSINEWRKAKEKALSELSGIERDSAKKTFDNMDTVIEQQNRQREEDIKLTQEKQKTEGTQQTANRASANASNASAELSRQQAKTEDDLREVRKFAIDLGNHMQGLEYGFNIDTYQSRLDKFASDVGIAKWTSYLTRIEAQDRAAYNAVQRIIMGKGTKEDGKTLWNFINDGRQLIPFK